MNPKNALFISATLTAFVVAVLFGVVTKITNNGTQTVAAAPEVQQAAVVQNTTVPTDLPTELPAPTAELPLGPEEAAALAAKALGQEDVYSVETSTYQGLESYKVVFSSGDILYVGLDRQILAKTKLQATIVSVDPTKAPKKNKNNNSVNPPPSNPNPPDNHDDDKKDEDHKDEDHNDDDHDD